MHPAGLGFSDVRSVLNSELPKAVESAVGAAVTMRTWAAALKILAKC
jgi:hypothetical protein